MNTVVNPQFPLERCEVTSSQVGAREWLAAVGAEDQIVKLTVSADLLLLLVLQRLLFGAKPGSDILRTLRRIKPALHRLVENL